MAEPRPGRGSAAQGPAAQDPAALQAEIEQVLAVGEEVRYQIQAVEEQRVMLQDVLQDYARGRSALEALKAGATGEGVLVPLGGGNFVHARIQGAERVITSIGSGLHVENDVDRAMKRLEERIDSATKASDKLAEESRRLSQEMQSINMRLQSYSQGGQGPR